MNREELNAFSAKLLQEALKGGIDAAEVYCQGGESFSVSALDEQITEYEVSSSCGLSLRGTVNGKMGYASTQAFDDEAIRQMIRGVLESASLTESEEQDELYAGDSAYPELPEMETDAAEIPAETKIADALRVNAAVHARDGRIDKAECGVSTSSGYMLLKNTLGLDLHAENLRSVIYSYAIAKDGDSTATGAEVACGRRYTALDPDDTAKKAAEDALSQLHASPVPAGEYRAIIRFDAMAALLTTFSGVFSAESAQENLSLLKDREGTEIASAAVTLLDDPLLPDGLRVRAFDDEGVATRRKAVIDRGVLTTLLHSRKTAKKAGTVTTGNAFRAGYSAPVHVAPTNFYFQPGERRFDELLAAMGEGLVITDVSGLHAGANPTSGDFSLLAKGYTVKDGKRERPVEQITVAGNFYTLLRQIRAFADDLRFVASPIGSPSADVGTLKVSG